MLHKLSNGLCTDAVSVVYVVQANRKGRMNVLSTVN